MKNKTLILIVGLVLLVSIISPARVAADNLYDDNVDGFDVEVLEAEPVMEGQEFEILLGIKNTSDSQDSQLLLVEKDNEVLDSISDVTLDPGEEDNLYFIWQTDVGDEGVYRLTASSADDNEVFKAQIQSQVVPPEDTFDRPWGTVFNPYTRPFKGFDEIFYSLLFILLPTLIVMLKTESAISTFMTLGFSSAILAPLTGQYGWVFMIVAGFAFGMIIYQLLGKGRRKGTF